MEKQYSDRIHFIVAQDDINLSSDWKLFPIDCKNIFTIKELFEVFAKVLEFPAYFGKNWGAFDECIWDMEWAKDKYNVSNIGIYFYNISNLLKKENIRKKTIFFEIMNSDYIVSKDDEQGNLNFPVNIQLYFNKDEEKYFIPTEPKVMWDSND